MLFVKRGLTLIELIFTIVIIAFVFSVVPKMFQTTNKSLAFSSKEDALFNIYSQMMDIILKEYDEKNTMYDDILLTGNNNSVLECNTTKGYRIGGFIGSRNCFHKVYESNIGLDANEPPRDDIDDYNGLNYQIYSGNKEYNLSVSVGYTDDWNKSDYSEQNLNFNFTNRSNDNKSNIKRVKVTVLSGNKEISSLVYDSANIGHMEIKSVQW